MSSGAVPGKAGKAAALPRFCKIESGSGGAAVLVVLPCPCVCAAPAAPWMSVLKCTSSPRLNPFETYVKEILSRSTTKKTVTEL